MSREMHIETAHAHAHLCLLMFTHQEQDHFMWFWILMSSKTTTTTTTTKLENLYSLQNVGVTGTVLITLKFTILVQEKHGYNIVKVEGWIIIFKYKFAMWFQKLSVNCGIINSQNNFGLKMS